MKKILSVLFIVLTLNVTAQKVVIPISPPEKKVLIVDETEVIKSGDKKFRIITSNDVISEKIVSQFKSTILLSINANERVVKCRGKSEVDWEYSDYFNNEEYNSVIIVISNGDG